MARRTKAEIEFEKRVDRIRSQAIIGFQIPIMSMSEVTLKVEQEAKINDNDDAVILVVIGLLDRIATKSPC